MMAAISARLAELVDALPLRSGVRVLEIGCGPGVAAREISRRIGNGYVLAIDRSATAIKQAIAGSGPEIASGRLGFIQCAAEGFELGKGEPRFDLAIAFRVGAFDGRHPEIEEMAIARVKAALKPKGRMFIDGGRPLQEIKL
ncbi:MAG: class I SAM-dependent methyltransferase [Hyphomicrobium sp.]|nr:class I SAM-dependent methyltransferase [Hyphomicrobium sp.]